MLPSLYMLKPRQYLAIRPVRAGNKPVPRRPVLKWMLVDANGYGLSHHRGREAANRTDWGRLQRGGCYRNRSRPLGLSVGTDRGHPHLIRHPAHRPHILDGIGRGGRCVFAPCRDEFVFGSDGDRVTRCAGDFTPSDGKASVGSTHGNVGWPTKRRELNVGDSFDVHAASGSQRHEQKSKRRSSGANFPRGE